MVMEWMNCTIRLADDGTEVIKNKNFQFLAVFLSGNTTGLTIDKHFAFIKRFCAFLPSGQRIKWRYENVLAFYKRGRVLDGSAHGFHGAMRQSH